MSEQEQWQQIGAMVVERRAARRELACWQQKVTQWSQLWQKLAARDLVDTPETFLPMIATYPSQQDVQAALEKIAFLHQEIERLTTLLKDCE